MSSSAFPFSGSFKSFMEDRRGSVAAIWAMVTLSTIITIGGAIDYSVTLTGRGLLQNALDSAVLSAVQTTSGSAAQTNVLVSRFRAILTGHTVLGDTSNLTPTLTTNADGSITATVTASVPTQFMKAAGISSVPVTVSSQSLLVPTPTPTTATFTMRVAKGWYWKRLTLYVVDASGKTNNLAQWVYQPFNQNYAFTSTQVSNLSWPMTNTFYSKGNSGNGVGTLTGPSGSITLGRNYKDAYLTMEVDTDGCPLDQVVDTSKASSSGGNNPLYCKNSTAKAPSWTFVTNTKDGITHMVKYGKKADGSPDGNNRTLFADKQSFQVIVPCSTPATTTYYGWEDTAGSPPSNLNDPNSGWLTQDFMFSITADSCDPNVNMVGTRLTQ